MLSQEQLGQIIAENNRLQALLQEANYILIEREQELAFFKENAARDDELKSRLDIQLEDFHSMQNEIADRERKVEGGEEREVELQQELTAAMRTQHQYQELLQQYIRGQANLTDIEEQYDRLKQEYLRLQEIAGKTAELESQLANTVMERDALLDRLNLLENSAGKKDISTEL